MSKAITDYTFGTPLRMAPDYIFNNVDLEDTDVFTAGVATSEEVFPGEVQNAVAIVINVDSDVETAETTGELEIEYLYGADFDKSITLLAVGDNITLSVGEVYRFVPPAGFVGSPAKVRITHTDATGEISVYPVYISR